MRHCVSPWHGGKACVGPEVQTKPCNIALCPVEGQWLDWGTWSRCSVSCSNGTQQRTRKCSVSAHGLAECKGAHADARECYNPECPEPQLASRAQTWKGMPEFQHRALPICLEQQLFSIKL
ncbi:UNVERIFIED_CONTAM: hypothetical protein K2H54_042816 [Gekko kuhli]